MELMDVLSASGHENAVRSYLMKKTRAFAKQVTVDKFGNLIIHKKGKGSTVMLVAHMDEIGLMIKSISPEGIIKISPVGVMDPLSCLNQKVIITSSSKKKIAGVVSTVHLSSGETITELPKKEELIVDTGLTKKELLSLGVDVGNFLEFEQKSSYLGSQNYIMGKAADDRVGCYILLQLIKKAQKSKADIYFVFTVQEEVGLYGAKTSVYNLNPEWALVLDMFEANDATEEKTRILGKGPLLTVMDAQLISNSCLNDTIKSIAKKKKISLQIGVSELGTTDALSISLSKGGTPTTVLGAPVRNIHSGIGIVHRKDIEDTIRIIEDLLKNPPKICL